MRHLRHALALGALVAVSIPATPALEAQNMGDAIIAATEYREIGPTRQSGRFVDIAVPADDPHTFYIATASGGLWRTNNRGISFDVLFADQADVFSIGAIAVSQTNSNVLYLGSGEGNNSRSSYWGNGMYKSTDYGDTWTNVGLPESHHFGRIVVHPTNPDVVYAAALGKLYSENDERGLYKTTNGGRSWDQVLAPDVEGRTIGVVDVVMSPADPNTLYAATYDKVRLPYTFDLAGPGSRVYKTTDGGDNWIQIGAGLPEGMLGRIGIDVYDKDPNILYATIENANKADMSDEDRREELLNHESSRGMIGGEVYRSNDAGLTWERASEEGGNVGGGPAYYYGQVIVDPNDADKAYVLSASSWGTSNGGETWERRAFGNIGGDDHALWINPNDSEHMILGYDHGMGVTYDAGENWYHPDFQSLAQFYAIGLDNSYPYRVAGGLQDNGSAMAYNTNPAGGPVRLEDWSRVGGGDGMFNEFDWCEGRFLYNESQFGPISRLDLETGESKGIRHQDADMRYNWMAPIMVSPHNCDVVFHAGNKLMRSPFRGETWEVISPDLSKNDPATLTTGKGGDGNIQYGTITTIDESILKAGLIWAGTDDGNVQVTQDGGDNWADVTDNIPNNPEYWVTRVEASHHELGTAYVSFSGLRNDDFGAYVYKTSNFGESWTDISSNLPESSVNVVIEHYENPNLLFVGTDLQVHASLDGGMNWQSMKGDMPTVPVHDIEIHTRENDLVVGTHGRGIYIADVSELSQVNSMNMTAQAHLFDPEDKVRYVASDRMNRSYSNFDGESEPSGSTLGYYLGSGATNVSVSIYRSTVMIAELEGETEAGFHEIMWDMTSRRERSEAEQEVARGQNQGGGRGGFGRGRGGPDRTRFEVNEAPAGEYRVVLTVDGQEMDSTVRILKDEWAAERR
ncbi:MAG: hypothetical protein HN463_11720 [Gemmatimonadales bacterium]|jgi:photosystem II stability/assembly factor-like uncharacterized protein|nr:hypothetical protein [Gemmatimonadales bacterium]MBT3775481.1 hypothetical protein [Gemmatimonadales bacterium]MBT5696882.1 hypothetical protein [Gemmatimonadales bacterium]MBT6374989.1 hypothetical protein [Gemmatimonadales bacterium]MBT6696686.1 hypothetical protein [Gemmatimonadales bacterium]